VCWGTLLISTFRRLYIAAPGGCVEADSDPQRCQIVGSRALLDSYLPMTAVLFAVGRMRFSQPWSCGPWCQRPFSDGISWIEWPFLGLLDDASTGL